MSRYRVFAVTVLFAWGAVYGQTVAVELAFSVASVKRVPLGASVYEETPESIRYRCALINLVQRAYELAPYQLENRKLLGEPTDQYEVLGKLAEGSHKGDIPAMLRSLLKERFHFSAHWQEESLQVYRLTLDESGLKLRRHVNGSREIGTPRQIIAPRTGLVHFEKEATLADLAVFLTSAMDHPVVDATGTGGAFDILLDAKVPAREVDMSTLPLFQGKSNDGGTGSTSPTGDMRAFGAVLYGNAPDIGTALSRLGLRLKSSRDNVRVLIVDSVDKKPTEN